MRETWTQFWSQDGPKLQTPWKSDLVTPSPQSQVGSQTLIKSYSGTFVAIFGWSVSMHFPGISNNLIMWNCVILKYSAAKVLKIANSRVRCFFQTNSVFKHSEHIPSSRFETLLGQVGLLLQIWESQGAVRGGGTTQGNGTRGCHQRMPPVGGTR